MRFFGGSLKLRLSVLPDGQSAPLICYASYGNTLRPIAGLFTEHSKALWHESGTKQISIWAKVIGEGREQRVDFLELSGLDPLTLITPDPANAQPPSLADPPVSASRLEDYSWFFGSIWHAS